MTGKADGNDTEVSRREKKPLRISSRWWAPLAATIWLYLLTKIFVFDVDAYLLRHVFPDAAAMVLARVLFFGLVASLFAIFGSLKSLAWFIVFLIAYPLIWILWRFAFFVKKYPKSLLPTAVFVSAYLHDWVTNWRFKLGVYAMTIASVASLILFDETIILWIATAGCVCGVVASTYSAMGRAYRETVFGPLTRLTQKLALSVSSGKFDGKSEASENGTEGTNSSNNPRVNLYCSFAVTDAIRVGLKDLTSTRKIDLMLLCNFVVSVTTIIVLFGFVAYGTSKADENAFSVGRMSLIQSMRYSFAVFASGSLSDAFPVSAWAVAFSAAGTFFKYVVGPVILFFTIVTASKERYLDGVEELIEAIDSVQSAVCKRMEDVLNQAIEEAEIALMTEKPGLVASLRKMRGLPPLPTEPASGAPKPDEGGDSIAPSERFID